MIRNLIRRYWEMPRDWQPGYKSRHRGRPALVAAHVEPAEHAGATADWSPTAELARVQVDREPEETTHEAAEREAEELAHHWAELEKQAEEEVTAECAAVLDPVLGPLYAAVEDACRAALDGLGITEADIDEYAKQQTSGFDLSELRRLIGATA